MAAWKGTVRGYAVRIHNVDHAPPHCHALVEGKDLKVTLYDLSVMNPPPHELPPKLRKGLASRQNELWEAWEDVIVMPAGGTPEWEGG